MQRPRTTRHPAATQCSPGPGGEAAGRRWGADAVRAFTLVELLVVIAIIGILAASSMPAIRSLMQSNTIASANRQILDDLAMARQSAISGRRTVYLVFVPPTLVQHKQLLQGKETEPQLTRDLRQLTNLASGQYTSYALFTRRTVGDQPGRETPRYLSEWKQLPDGVFFVPNRFVDLGDAWVSKAGARPETNRELAYGDFPFPRSDSWEARMPYIAFNAKGQITYDGGLVPNFRGEAVSIARGSIFHARNAVGQYLLMPPTDIVETPKGSQMNIRVNWLTGRAKVDQPELK